MLLNLLRLNSNYNDGISVSYKTCFLIYFIYNIILAYSYYVHPQQIGGVGGGGR